MLIAVIVAGIVVGLVRSRPARFGPPRAVVVVFAAAIAQVVSTRAHGPLHTVLLVGSISLGLIWVVAQRRHLASVLLTIGVGSNVAVIAANSGMPVSESALSDVGRRDTDVTAGFLYKHVPMTGATRLSWLGDGIPIPIQRNVISIGDVVMAVAIGLWTADCVGGWRASRRSAGAVDGELRGGARGKVVGRRE